MRVEGEGRLAGPLRSALASQEYAAVVILAAADADTLVARVRSASEPVVLVVLDEAALDSLQLALLTATIGPLAVELAPTRRLCAASAATTAQTPLIAATLRYLANARSTTGQVLRVA